MYRIKAIPGRNILIKDLGLTLRHTDDWKYIDEKIFDKSIDAKIVDKFLVKETVKAFEEKSTVKTIENDIQKTKENAFVIGNSDKGIPAGVFVAVPNEEVVEPKEVKTIEESKVVNVETPKEVNDSNIEEKVQIVESSTSEDTIEKKANKEVTKEDKQQKTQKANKKK